ncbi:MAG: hypothetical protein HGB28_05055, partial [Oscillochloris sp.]|nr:hypothetical protein [Oscillochloris sp.]
VEATGSGDASTLRILLPAAASQVTKVILNGQPAAFTLEAVGLSQYVVLRTTGPIVQVQVTFS